MELGTIEEKVNWAREQFALCQGLFFSDPKLLELVTAFRNAVGSSHTEMQEAGIAHICRRCETEAGGSCCGAGIEDRYDQWILIANLLLGVNLQEARWKQDSCFFLGPNGCTLVARHPICVNYLCKDVTEQVAQEKIIRMRQKEGEELELLFLICERIKRIVKSGG